MTISDRKCKHNINYISDFIFIDSGSEKPSSINKWKWRELFWGNVKNYSLPSQLIFNHLSVDNSLSVLLKTRIENHLTCKGFVMHLVHWSQSWLQHLEFSLLNLEFSLLTTCIIITTTTIITTILRMDEKCVFLLTERKEWFWKGKWGPKR